MPTHLSLRRLNCCVVDIKSYFVHNKHDFHTISRFRFFLIGLFSESRRKRGSAAAVEVEPPAPTNVVSVYFTVQETENLLRRVAIPWFGKKRTERRLRISFLNEESWCEDISTRHIIYHRAPHMSNILRITSDISIAAEPTFNETIQFLEVSTGPSCRVAAFFMLDKTFG